MTEREFQKQLRNYHKTQIMSVELAMELLAGCRLECMYEDETWDAFEMAIKALEQKPCEDTKRNDVLDKIRAEIKEQYGGCGLINDGLDMALSVIDKYMAEDEE